MRFKQGHRKYTFNDSIFDKIDTKDKAYWIGFIFGDGSVSDYSLRIEINKRDKEHLEKISRFVNFNGVIKETKKDCVRIDFNSVVLVDSLNRTGIVKNKTHSDIVPCIPKRFISHFYRGLLDSDGWISYHKNKFDAPNYDIGFSSNNVGLLTDIRLFLADSLGKTKIGTLNTKHRCPQLIIGGTKQFIKVTDILYKDSNTDICLDRKSEKTIHAREKILTHKDRRYNDNKNNR